MDDRAWAKAAVRTLLLRCVRSLVAEIELQAQAWARRSKGKAICQSPQKHGMASSSGSNTMSR